MSIKRTGKILAFDKSTFTNEDRRLLKKLAPYFDILKVGLEAMTAEGKMGRSIAAHARQFALEALDKEVMWDMKINDVRTTTLKAIHNIGEHGSCMTTLHATINNEAMRLACAECKRHGMLSIAVTVLTDLDQAQCYSRFGNVPDIAVFNFARMAQANGAEAITCSPAELAYLRPTGVLKGLKTITPGIRPHWAKKNGQERSVTPTEAVRLDTDFVVFGSPVFDPPDGMTPLDAILRINEEMELALV